jgi:hypothetical protein
MEAKNNKSDKHLVLNRPFSLTVKFFDAEMLFDLFEKQFNCPA